MSVEVPPKPAPRKRNVAAKSSTSSVTRSPSVSISTKDLEVKGLRGKLDELSMQELRNILEDAAAIHGLISSLSVPQLDAIQSNRDNAAAENRRLAEQNMEFKPEVEKLRNELTTVEATVKNLMDAYTQHYEQLPELVKKLDNQRILGQLQRSVSELESQTEEVAENFLASKINEDQFMDQYIKSRVSFWLRKVKAEKMDELLNPSAPNVPLKRSQPPKPSPYQAGDGIRGNSAQMPTLSHPTAPSTQPPPTQQQPYHQPPPPTQQPYRQPVPPVSAAPQAAPYQQPHPQYQPQHPQYQYPHQQQLSYQYPPQQPRYHQQPPVRPYPAQAGYRAPAYPQQPRYPPQPRYRQPPPAGYYPTYQPQPYRYR